MANLLSAVRTYLLSKTAVTDLIGQRMYFDRLPQNAGLPAATLSIVSSVHDHDLSDRTGLVWKRMQVSCFAARRTTCDDLAAAIYQSGLVAVRGLTNGVLIRGVQVEDGERAYTIDAEDGSDDHQYVSEFDFRISYQES